MIYPEVYWFYLLSSPIELIQWAFYFGDCIFQFYNFHLALFYNLYFFLRLYIVYIYFKRIPNCFKALFFKFKFQHLILINTGFCLCDFVGTCFGQRQETPTVLYLGYMGINKKPRELVFMSLRLGVHLFSTLRVFLYSLVVLLPWFFSCKGRDLIKIWLLYTGRIKSLG